MFQSGCADFIAYFLCYRQPKNMRRDFGASLLKRPNVDAGRLLDCPDNYELPHRGKSINPPSCARKIGLCEPGEHTSGPNLASRDNVAHNPTLYTILETPPPVHLALFESRPGTQRTFHRDRGRVRPPKRRGHIATFRGNAALRSLSELSGH